MSATPTMPGHAARTLTDQRQGELMADRKRGEFLRALDESDYEVSEWDAGFIASFLDLTSNRPGDEARWWTPGRRIAADRMMGQYPEVAAGRLAGTLAPPRIPASAPAGLCNYLVSGEDRVQRRCCAAATVKLRHGLELCAEHERERQAWLARARAKAEGRRP